MRTALALLAARGPRADQSSPVLTVVASDAADGPLVQGLSAGVVLTLVAQWATDYPAFLVTAESLVNGDVVTAETAQPEGAPMQMVLTGLVDPLTGSGVAGRLAAAVNQQWAAGRIVDASGESIPAWPGASAIAYANNGATVTVQWIKGQPWVWIVVGVLLAIAALALYETLARGGYTLSAAVPGSVGQAAAAFGAWLLRNWPAVLVGAGVLSAAPFVVRELARAREAANEAKFAARGGF